MAATNNNLANGNAINKLVAAAKADPKKAGVLTILLVVLAVMLSKRLSAHGPGPAAAVASASAEGADPAATSARNAAAATAHKSDQNAFEQWRLEPIAPAGRNLFAVNLDVFPPDGVRVGGPKVEGDGFWDQMAKSLALQADSKTKRQAIVSNLQSEAAKLRLQSTVMGAVPKALINGDLVREGDVVASFRVLKIEARRIIVEREGIKLEILMN